METGAEYVGRVMADQSWPPRVNGTIDPQEAREILRRYFEENTREQIIADLAKYSPELLQHFIEEWVQQQQQQGDGYDGPSIKKYFHATVEGFVETHHRVVRSDSD